VIIATLRDRNDPTVCTDGVFLSLGELHEHDWQERQASGGARYWQAPNLEIGIELNRMRWARKREEAADKARG
jgi:hypothetical protein